MVFRVNSASKEDNKPQIAPVPYTPCPYPDGMNVSELPHICALTLFTTVAIIPCCYFHVDITVMIVLKYMLIIHEV